jgi:SAM-dependent methyltransferase
MAAPPGLKLNVGCGIHVVSGYHNLDNSPSLRIQNNLCLRAAAHLLERVLRRRVYTRFPKDARWCDVTQGLPYNPDRVKVIYSSHMLEHLPRKEAEQFLREAYRVLMPQGILRLAVPDLERMAQDYLTQLERLPDGCFSGIPADEFMRKTLLGFETRWNLKRPTDLYRVLFGREGHAWMWDAPSLIVVLRIVGFRQVWKRNFGESLIPEVEELDSEGRREDSFYVEAQK